mgnify:CR=1 FL=1
MTPTDIATGVFAVAGALGAYVAGKKGGKEGSSGALNGTAETVRRSESLLLRLDSKLAGHIDRTSEALTDLTSRVGVIEGRCDAMFDHPRHPRA